MSVKNPDDRVPHGGFKVFASDLPDNLNNHSLEREWRIGGVVEGDMLQWDLLRS